MAFATVSAVGGVIKLGANVVEGRRQKIKAEEAKQNAEKAQKSLEKQKDMFMHLDTSNPYLNMQNVAEDLVVNQQQSQFEAQQNQQNQANIMDSLGGAAGGSGIAGLAQAMANQGAQSNQAASASIGQQESANQSAQVSQEANIQNMERRGEMMSRQMESSKLAQSMQFTSDDVMNAKKEQAVAEMRRKDRNEKAGAQIEGAIGGGISSGSVMGGLGTL